MILTDSEYQALVTKEFIELAHDLSTLPVTLEAFGDLMEALHELRLEGGAWDKKELAATEALYIWHLDRMAKVRRGEARERS